MKITRNTVQREIILNTVLNMDNHPSADEVYEELRYENPSISRATVYRNLELLSKLGKILYVEMPKGATCFDFNTSDHCHIRCAQCKKVFDIDIPEIPKIEYNNIDTKGFVVNGYSISFSGVCPNCQNK